MRKLMLVYAGLCALALAVSCGSAQAQSNRTWVSAGGADTGTCSQTAPCLTFGYAIGQTSSGGEIDCLSGGGFGAVTITQPTTIDCGAGQVGGIAVSGTNAINVAATSGTIVLRNLTLNGLGGGGNTGISASGFNGTLIVQHCGIHGFSADGILFNPTSNRGLLEVSDTAIYGNGGAAIVVEPASGVIASAVLNRVELNGNNYGLVLEGSGVVAGTLRQSVAAENSINGVLAEASGGVYFTVEESSVIDNLADGVTSQVAGVNLEVGASTIGGNGTGVIANEGSIFTFGNNQISANGSNGSFTPGGPKLQ